MMVPLRFLHALSYLFRTHLRHRPDFEVLIGSLHCEQNIAISISKIKELCLKALLRVRIAGYSRESFREYNFNVSICVKHITLQPICQVLLEYILSRRGMYEKVSIRELFRAFSRMIDARDC